MTSQPHDKPPRDSASRFAFGENWRSFLNTVDEARIDQAVDSLRTLLGINDLRGQTFLDIGSGSGLFSLAASRLGAAVTSIDYDPDCVECTDRLRQRFGSPDADWIIRRGDILDPDLMRHLGAFDVVYSWGVLHHTGNMTAAIDAAAERVEPNGLLAIAIYHDQGSASRRWLAIKTFYHRLPTWLQPAWVVVVASWYESKFAIARLVRGRNPLPFSDWRAKRLDRGMSAWHDWVDWVGGLPFEVATPEAIIMPMISRGFELRYLSTVGNGWGCNEYVFRCNRN